MMSLLPSSSSAKGSLVERRRGRRLEHYSRQPLSAPVAIMMHSTVLVFETMPIFSRLEWLRERFPKIALKMESIPHCAPILAIIGLGLSSIHQSSLGAAYGIIKGHPF